MEQSVFEGLMAHLADVVLGECLEERVRVQPIDAPGTHAPRPSGALRG